MGDILALGRQCHDAPRRRLEGRWKLDLDQRCLRRNLPHHLDRKQQSYRLAMSPETLRVPLGSGMC